MDQIKIKYFTPSEALKTLPLVKQIVQDILYCGGQIKSIAESTFEDIEENGEALRLADDIKSYMKELEEIGCYYKDWNFSIGLIDFPSIINNEEVFLCWRSDEESISYYHGVFEGYAGRKKIPNELLDA